MLGNRQFVTEAGKLITEVGKREPKKKQVVETTCGSHEKTSRDSSTKPGKPPLKKLTPRKKYFSCRRKLVTFLFRQHTN